VSLRFLFYLLLLLVTIVYGLYCYKSLSKPFRVLVLLVLCVFLSECLGRWFVHKHQSNFPSYHILILAQMILYPYIYLNVLPALSGHGKIITALGIAGFCFSAINSFFIQTFYVFPSYSILLLSLFIVCMALLSFYYMLEQPEDRSPLKAPLFWMNFGNLFFYCITFFMFGFFTPFIKRTGNLPEWAFIFIFAANLGLYVCYLVALHLEKKRA